MRFIVPLLLVLIIPGVCQALVMHNDSFPPDRPPDGVVGRFGGGSCVAIGPEWVLVTVHQGGDVGSSVTIGGATYRASEVYASGYDLRLVRVVNLDGSPAALQDYVDVSWDASAAVGREIVLGGWGLGRGAATTTTNGGYGYQWASPSILRWGTNIVKVIAGAYVYAYFEGPGARDSTAFEAALAAGDSGGGWFLKNGTTGRWEVIGLCRGTERLNVSVYTPDPDMIHAASVAVCAAWITGIAGQQPPAPAPAPEPAPPPPAPAPTPQAVLAVTGGSGSGTYSAGSVVTIAAQTPQGQTFLCWTGDTGTVADASAAQTTITVNADCAVTAVFQAAIVAAATLDWTWVYQNTPATTQWRNKCLLTIRVTSDPNGNSRYGVSVAPNAQSAGKVVVVPTANPLVWVLEGGQRGVAPTGTATLNINVSGADRGGQGAATASLVVRPIGDITGDGLVNTSDKSQMSKKLAGRSVKYDARYFDLNGDGVGGNAADNTLLQSILKGATVP